MKRLWWGYIHTSGTIQVKPLFDMLDIKEAKKSPFCKKVIEPFEAEDRDDALNKIKELL